MSAIWEKQKSLPYAPNDVNDPATNGDGRIGDTVPLRPYACNLANVEAIVG